jgi:predicted metal-dependent hydrolase
VKRAEQTSFVFGLGEAVGTVPRVARERQARSLAPRPAPAVAASSADPTELARQRLERRIGAHLPGRRLALAVTDNRYTMISVKREKGLFRLRLHHMFLDAEPEVVRALGRYVGDNDRDSSTLLGRFIDIHQHRIGRARSRRPAAVTLETRGEIHHLQLLYDDLNQRYFAGHIDARITWGLRTPEGGRRRRRNSIKMGSYSVEDRLIRIHPSLDRDFVPRYFVEWIVYHEMLHQKHHIPVVGGRRQFHTPEFKAEEATFEHFDRARRWERENLDRLLFY